MQALKKIDPPGGIELLSYKRIRGIAIIKKGKFPSADQGTWFSFVLILNGNSNFRGSLKTMIKREFPRSGKVRLITFRDPQELDRTHQKI